MTELGSDRPFLDTYGWCMDLLIVSVLVVGASVALLVPGVPQPIEWVLAVPFLIFLPGYAIISVLFPEPPTEPSDDQPNPGSTPDWIVRVALSLVLSAVIVAVIGVVIDWTATIRLAPAVVAIGTVTLLGVGITALRRARRVPEQRFDLFGGERPSFDIGMQTVTLALAVLLLIGAVTFVAAAPIQQEAYSEAYLLAENDDGELVAEEYPTTFVGGEEQSLFLGLENNEYRPVTYNVVVVVQQVDNGTVTVQQRLSRSEVELVHGEDTVIENQLAPRLTGDDLRLQFQVYKDVDPDDAEEPDYSLQLWIDVGEASGE